MKFKVELFVLFCFLRRIENMQNLRSFYHILGSNSFYLYNKDMLYSSVSAVAVSYGYFVFIVVFESQKYY